MGEGECGKAWKINTYIYVYICMCVYTRARRNINEEDNEKRIRKEIKSVFVREV